ncbi:unnamed protein product [Rhodiola kirilowii]
MMLQRSQTSVTFILYLQKNVAFGGKDAKTRKLEKQQAEAESAVAATGTSEEAPLVTRQNVEPDTMKEEAQSGEASTVLKEPEPEPTANAAQAEPVTEQQPQPKPEHHKRNEDAVVAAKERYLARKRMKEL